MELNFLALIPRRLFNQNNVSNIVTAYILFQPGQNIPPRLQRRNVSAIANQFCQQQGKKSDVGPNIHTNVAETNGPRHDVNYLRLITKSLIEYIQHPGVIRGIGVKCQIKSSARR